MRKTGMNEIGYACSYVPVEIIMAAGFSPLRLVPAGRCTEADSLMHPNTCCYLRSMLTALRSGAYSETQSIIFVNACDGMRKLFDIWVDAVDHPVAIFLDIPKKKDADSIRYFASELRRLATTLEENFNGLPVTVDKLNKAIQECNTIRSAARSVWKTLAGRDSAVRGSDVFPMLLEKSFSSIKEHEVMLGQDLAGPTGELPPDGIRRIIISGTILSKQEIIEMIEGRKAKIVAFDTCFGVKHYETQVLERTIDPFTAIAERYLTRPPCPRMEGITHQVEYLTSLVKDTRADGVIITPVKYCDQILYNLPLLQEGIKALGIPVLVLENDYEWSDPEKARTKVEAFLEMIPS